LHPDGPEDVEQVILGRIELVQGNVLEHDLPCVYGRQRTTEKHLVLHHALYVHITKQPRELLNGIVCSCCRRSLAKLAHAKRLRSVSAVYLHRGEVQSEGTRVDLVAQEINDERIRIDQRL